MIRFTEKDQEQLNKLSQGLRKNTRLDSGASIAAYQKKYANSGKMFKGKWRRWDSRTKTWYDPKLVTAYLNKQEYGTTTPKEDLKYLKALKSQTIKESGVQYNDPARINLSRKLVIDETNPYGTVYEKEQAARRNKDRVELTKIRRKSSYGEERDFGPNYKEKEESLFIAAGDEAQLPGSDANEALKIENRNAKGRVLSPKLQAGDIKRKHMKTVPGTAGLGVVNHDLKLLFPTFQ